MSNKPAFREDLVRRWVEALESGKYKQGKNTLVRKTGDGYEFCCLGVAYKVCRPKKKFTTEYAALSDDLLNSSLYKQLGLNQSMLKDYGDFEGVLMTLNDQKNKSFPYIAKWIRKYILKEKGIRLR